LRLSILLIVSGFFSLLSGQSDSSFIRPNDTAFICEDTVHVEKKDSQIVTAEKEQERFSTIPLVFPDVSMYDYWEEDHMNPYRFMKLPSKTKVKIKILPQDCDFSLPIIAPVTSRFGYRWGRPHNGIDLDLETGDSVCAAFDGVVRLSRWYYGFGNLIVIRHFNGLETCYAHLSKRALKPGDLVNAGEYIGKGGSTGHSTGAHLHFEIHFMGKPINPERIIDFKNATIKNEYLKLNPRFFKRFY